MIRLRARANRSRLRNLKPCSAAAPPNNDTESIGRGRLSARPLGRRRAPSALSSRDLVSETLTALLARPARSLLTILGTVLGVAAVVATVGIARTAGNRIVGRFDELTATDIVVTPRVAGTRSTAQILPWDAEERLTRLNGVTAAGTVSDVDLLGGTIGSVPLHDPTGRSSVQLPVKAASPGLYGAVRATLQTGRLPDGGHSARADRVAVLGPAAAQRLSITRVDQQPAIFLGERVYVVIGILSSVHRQPDLLNAIVIPEGSARADFGLASPASVQIDTQIGATRLIADQAPIALHPADPARLRVATAPPPLRAQEAVSNDLNALFLMLGGVSLLVGALGIANVTLVSVMERTGEIGLRRALGARPVHIATQFLAESAALGLLGGVVGASVGVLVVVVVAATHAWTPVLELTIPLSAPALGALIGLVAGLYPSQRAARMEPIEALRSAT